MPRHARGYDHLSTDLGNAYCQALLDLREHCEQTGQNYMQEVIDLVETKLTDDRRGKDAEGSA